MKALVDCRHREDTPALLSPDVMMFGTPARVAPPQCAAIDR